MENGDNLSRQYEGANDLWTTYINPNAWFTALGLDSGLYIFVW